MDRTDQILDRLVDIQAELREIKAKLFAPVDAVARVNVTPMNEYRAYAWRQSLADTPSSMSGENHVPGAAKGRFYQPDSAGGFREVTQPGNIA